MRVPEVIKADDLRNFYYLPQIKINGHMYIAKTYGEHCLCLGRRIKLAYLVFTGELDALDYKGKEPKPK